MSWLLLVGKCLGVAYLLYAFIVLVVGIVRTIAFTTLAIDHRADIQGLTVVPFVIMFLLCLVIGLLLGFTGLRLWAAKRTPLTWVVVCASIVAFPVGTILGLPSLIWLILLRRSQNSPPAFAAPISATDK
jgi:hypothetical protein